MPSTTGRPRDERGFVLPTRLLALSISAVAVAGLVFIANDPDKGTTDRAATPTVSKPSATATATPTPTEATKPAKPAKKKPKPIKRGEVFVEVYNNTRITGLAGGAAGRAKAAGWNVVGSENWYGTVEGSTVYYPPRLKRAAAELGRDLGIERLQPAQDPMRFDRLTVILTEDYSG